MEVADYLGVSERTVRRLMRNHSLPYTKLGGALLFRKSDLEATIAAATFPSHAMLSRRGCIQRSTCKLEGTGQIGNGGE